MTMGDAGVTADAAVSRASDSGCGCQLGGTGERPALALALLALVVLLRRRARQW